MRIRVFPFLLAIPLVALGLSCGGNDGPTDGGMDGDVGSCEGLETCGIGGSGIRCPSSGACSLPPVDCDDGCEAGFQCGSDSELEFDCTGDCAWVATNCEPKDELPQGILADFLTMAELDDGTIIFAGYAPGFQTGGTSLGLTSGVHQDLVFGTYDEESQSTTWEIIDGVPEDGEPVADPEGWRNGLNTPGDDVGQFADIEVYDDNIYVAYYDATNGDLKFALRREGEWSTHTVSSDGDAGRYPSIALLPSMNEGVPPTPFVAFQILVPADTDELQPSARVDVIRANTPFPNSTDDWGIQLNVDSTEIPCRIGLCGGGRVCNLNTFECALPADNDDCDPACEGSILGDEQCVQNADDTFECAPVTFTDDRPPFIGLYNQLRTDPTGGLAIAYYDRKNADLRGARFNGTSWSDTFLINGVSRGDGDVGDSGISVSLIIGADGTWHLSYLDGGNEFLRYIAVPPGEDDFNNFESIVVDTGEREGNPTMRFFVGVDTAIGATDSGVIRIAYQDSTNLELLVSECDTNGFTEPCNDPGESTWTRTTLDSTNETGFWNQQLVDGETSKIATWYTDNAVAADNGVRVFEITTESE